MTTVMLFMDDTLYQDVLITFDELEMQNLPL